MCRIQEIGFWVSNSTSTVTSPQKPGKYRKKVEENKSHQFISVHYQEIKEEGKSNRSSRQNIQQTEKSKLGFFNFDSLHRKMKEMDCL